MEFPSYPGKPIPLGASKSSGGYNFALFSREGQAVAVCFFDATQQLIARKALDPGLHKTGDIWHIKMDLPPEAIFYAYQIQASERKNLCSLTDVYLLDPYALGVSTSCVWGKPSAPSTYNPLGVLPVWEAFDWQGVVKPQINPKDSIIYEMHVRGFTRHASSQVKHPGTFLGVVEKIPYLLELGINTVELLPLQEFDETEVRLYKLPKQQRLCNYWGYSTVNFFSPMNRYAVSASPGMPVNEFKTMVRELHRHGIEVILDVVYNHTAEGNEEGPILSFKGIDPEIYYLYDQDGKLSNYSGCGNTFNCNHPVARQLILESLRYWALEMQVDGFRFDLASILQRGTHGEPSNYSPLVEEITEDPLLAGVKLIAEPWDAVGLYHVGDFASQNLRWREWNDKYRDKVRKFIKGTSEANLKGNFITRICGSQDLYGNRSPLNSINFITAHDGFNLRDLVSYNEKHNEANGEDNRDGNPRNESWNCGQEGPTDNMDIINLREKQMRNFHLALMISQGIPMLLMGDEYGHTRNGNNNTWCQDNELNWFLWGEIQKNAGFFRFYKKLIQFRKDHPLLRRDKFLTPEDVLWHGLEPLKPEWDNGQCIVAFTLLDTLHENDLYIVFNADGIQHEVKMPQPRGSTHWYWVVNTANESPADFYEEEAAPHQDRLEFILPPYSAGMLKALH